MDQTISSPEKSISEYAPKILTMKIDPDKLGTVIGPSGKTVKKISETNEVEVNIENDGTITIYGKNSEQAYNAQKMVEDLVEEPEVGTIYEGTVKRIMDFGAFVEILPGKEGLCHISKLAKHHVNKVRDVVNEGDTLKVKLIEIDKMGRYNLSHVDAIDSDASKSGKPSGKPSEKQKTDDKKGQRHNPSNRRRGS
jgi:polyribonucleotide nucleotidyltransferase